MSESSENHKIQAKLDQILVNQNQHQLVLEGLERTVRGSNGEAGLVGRVSVLEAQQGTIKRILLFFGGAMLTIAGWFGFKG